MPPIIYSEIVVNEFICPFKIEFKWSSYRCPNVHIISILSHSDPIFVFAALNTIYWPIVTANLGFTNLHHTVSLYCDSHMASGSAHCPCDHRVKSIKSSNMESIAASDLFHGDNDLISFSFFNFNSHIFV